MITCIICPKGCKLNINKENEKFIVTGNKCIRGIKYGIDEVTNPLRKITTTVKVNGSYFARLPVESDIEISKKMIFEVINLLNKVVVYAPITYKQIIIENILNTGANIISTRSMIKSEIIK